MPKEIITNFTGKLTKNLIGDLNSGFASMQSSYGYNPFGVPKYGLNWFPSMSANLGGTMVTDLILHQRLRIESDLGVVYGVGYSGNVYQIKVNDAVPTPDLDSITKYANALTSVSSSHILNYGGGMLISQVDGTERIYVGTDAGVVKTSANHFTPAIATWAAITGATLNANVPRAGVEFLGKQYWANGNNLAEIDSTGNFTTAAKLNPALPKNFVIRDLDVDPEGRYLIIVASKQPAFISNFTEPPAYYGVDTLIGFWNGVDSSLSSYFFLYNFNATSLITAGRETYIFGQDERGAVIRTLSNKVYNLFDNPFVSSQPPNVGSVAYAGDKIYFLARQGINWNLFCFGRNDIEDETGLWNLGVIDSNEANIIGSILIPSLHSRNEIMAIDKTRSKIYLGLAKDGADTGGKFYRWHLQPYGNVQRGAYHTQTKLYDRQVKINNIRVYYVKNSSGTAPSFILSIYDEFGSSVSSTTVNIASGDLDVGRKDIVIKIKNLYGYSLHIKNNSTVNFHILKIEVDYEYVER